MPLNSAGPSNMTGSKGSPVPNQDDNESRFLSSCEDSSLYPTNLKLSLVSETTLKTYYEALLNESERLFDTAPRPKLLKFWETNSECSEFGEYQPSDVASLKNHCQESNLPDPACRYVFIRSRNARARLGLTRDDFTYLSTYHQVMPSFLDLLFTCGRQEGLRSFYYTAFRHGSYLSKDDTNTRNAGNIPRLGRSGRLIQNCYNLHSVERSASTPEWGWSIRQTIVYNSFDVETGKSFWIFIKGNETMEGRIVGATNSAICADMNASSHQTPTKSFNASLAAHFQVIEWCGGQWRDYVNELDERLRKGARDVLIVDVDNLTGPSSVPILSRPGTFINQKSTRATTSKSQPSSPLSQKWSSLIRFPSMSKGEKTSTVTETELMRPTHADQIVEEPEQIDNRNDNDNDNVERVFSFEKLQGLHHLGEHLQEALMVLRLNRGVIEDIIEYYATITEGDGFPCEIKGGCKSAVAGFQEKARGVEKELGIQQLRLETLSILLKDRCNLFHTAQQYANMQASKHFAKNAQISTNFTTGMAARMHVMTEKMHDVALRTGHQTVSMHAITVFTLVFLPGTFLAVSILLILDMCVALMTRQTFFSSGILRWQDSGDGNGPGQGYSWVTERDRLFLYFEISAPMMFLVVVGWLILFLRGRNGRDIEDERQQLDELEKGFYSSAMGKNFGEPADTNGKEARY
ncbi:hypothetical protein GGS23DRAFT_578793 [Durotheca rogersii]|uniref:uncharacterized protein n=1 Tax=Durotheca rogersii TaxID=419775 RepID=UPI00221F67EE|nr:uncharacterized protein GGS23DRAFT_578793 [Durotheca rogersii]KAI5861107.1 hypothetical protein GGS23DRAFT_578793 [Durotheca rogersii]